jgi:two-component system, LuxR family, sensor kinase FixL
MSIRHTAPKAMPKGLNFETIFNKSEQCAIIHDANTGDVIWANQAAAALHGYTQDEMPTLTLADLMSRSLEYGSDRAIEKMLSAVRQGRETAKWRIRNRNDEELPIEATAFPLPDWNGRKLVVVQIRDIGPELIAQRREEQLRRLLTDSFGGTLISDADGLVLYAAPSIFSILGYSEDYFCNKKVELFIHPDDNKRLRKYVRSLCPDSDNTVTIEYRIRHADGDYRHHEASMRDLRKHEDVGGFLINFRDVTARVEAQQDARLRLEEIQYLARYRTIAELGSAIAHELGQPVAAIRNYAAGCAKTLKALPDNANLRWAIQQIEAEAERASRIMKSTRDFTSRGTVNRHVLNVEEILSEIESFISFQAKEWDAIVKIEIEATTKSAWCDKTLIGQVLLNLVMNAVQSMKSAEPARREVCILVKEHGAHFVEFIVSDRGAGMEKSQIDTLFQERASTKAENFGIGLLLSKSIVTGHGGAIWAESKIGESTSIHFTLRKRKPRNASLALS